MRCFILFTFTIIRLYSFSQTSENLIRNQCERIISGKPEANGIKIRYSVPCDWDSTKETRTYAVSVYSKEVIDSGRLAIVIAVTKKNQSITKKDEENLFKESWVKELMKPIGELINVKKVEIDAHNWAEYTFMKTVNAPQGEIHEIITSYNIYCKGRLISVSYKAMGRDLVITGLLYVNYLEAFQTMASGIHVFNFWQ